VVGVPDETAGRAPDRSAEGVGDTRSRILGSALELFAARGYERTSLRQIAERLGVSKAAVLYHFPTKDRILAELAEPLVRDLEIVLDRAAALPPRQARWAAVEGLLDTFLAHRQALLTARHDLAIMTQQRDVYQRMFAVGARAHEIIAGPAAGPAERIRASQALACLGDPVIYFPDLPVPEIRELILDGARRILDEGGPRVSAGSAGSAGRHGSGGGPGDRGGGRSGRPRALAPERLAAAQRMYAEGGRSVGQIAAELGVSRATLYRHLDRDGAPSQQSFETKL
jgi:AcrR family transcriptional regulator